MAAANAKNTEWRDGKNARRRFGVRLAILTCILLFSVTGLLEGPNLSLMDMRFKAIDRKPSGSIVLIAIDPESLREEESWPWSRQRYAQAMENLQDAGARIIGYDIDFSSLGDVSGDAAFADAIARRPGDTVLPVFAQWSGVSKNSRKIIETPPNDIFLHDSVLASVNLETERNGIVRKGWWGFMKEGAYRPSMASMLAGYPGAPTGNFYIDFSIDPESITRISFKDVLAGDFSRDQIEGKTVLFGATALELGDEFAAPVYGLTHGAVLHALSYESIYQQRVIARTQPIFELIAAIFVIALLCGTAENRSNVGNAFAYAGIGVAAFAAPVLIQYNFPVSVDTAAVFVALTLSIVYNHAQAFQRKALELVEQRGISARYQALSNLVVRDSFDGVMVVDENGNIDLVNDRGKKFLGINDEDQISLHICDLADDFPLHPANDFGKKQEKKACPNDKFVSEFETSENRVLEVSSSGFVYERRNSPRHKNSTPPYVFVYSLRDITAQREKELDELKTKEALIAADRMKSQLLANIRHELRTPLNGVIGFADILQKEAFGPLGVNEYKEYSTHIYESGTRLLNLVNDIFTVSRIESGDVEMKPDFNSISDVLNKALRPFNRHLSGEEISLDEDCLENLPYMKFDFEIMEEMLKQLISNAVKFTQEDRRIEVHAAYVDECLAIEIRDNGCGVDAALLPEIRRAFVQGDGALNRLHEGAGLGLFIVDSFASLHGAKLELENNQSGFTACLIFEHIECERHEAAA